MARLILLHLVDEIDGLSDLPATLSALPKAPDIGMLPAELAAALKRSLRPGKR
jgi:hypothetical protein